MTRRRMRRNPEGLPVLKIAVGAGVAYLAYRWLFDGAGKPVPPNAPSSMKPSVASPLPYPAPVPPPYPAAPYPAAPVTVPEATTVSAEIYGEPTEYEVATTIEASGVKGLGNLGSLGSRSGGKGIFASNLFG